MIRVAIFPLLFYAAPVWCSAIQFYARLHPLDRVIRLSTLSTLGLLRTTSCEAVMVLAVFLLAEIHIWQGTVEFHLRRLAYGGNLIFEEARCVGRTHVVSLLDILDAEVMRIDRLGDLSPQLLQRIESRIYWIVDSLGISLPPLPSILSSALSIQQICMHHSSAGLELLWVFMDALVDSTRCGAVAVLFVGSSTLGLYSVCTLRGPRCSTHAKLVAIYLAKRLWPWANSATSSLYMTPSLLCTLYSAHRISGPWHTKPGRHCAPSSLQALISKFGRPRHTLMLLRTSK